MRCRDLGECTGLPNRCLDGAPRRRRVSSGLGVLQPAGDGRHPHGQDQVSRTPRRLYHRQDLLSLKTVTHPRRLLGFLGGLGKGGGSGGREIDLWDLHADSSNIDFYYQCIEILHLWQNL